MRKKSKQVSLVGPCAAINALFDLPNPFLMKY